MSQLRDASERSYKSIVFEVLPEAISSERSVTGRLDLRGLFYAARRLYLAHPERPFGLEARMAAKKKNPENIIDYSYFGNRIVPEYEQVHGDIPGLIREARGHLHEAHTDNAEGQAIGTVFVEGFEPPEYFYDKVLYVEKHGVAQGLVDQHLGEKYDMAIVASKGYRTEADGALLRRFAEEGYELYILHDCDIDGYGIFVNLQDGNARVEGLDVEAIDLGMSLEDTRSMGLLGEEATRAKSIPEGVVTYVTDDELALFTGTQRNAKTWEYTRFELNEIPAAERLPFVERALQAAGVGPKVIPPDDYLAENAAERRDSDIRVEVAMAVDEVIDVEEIKDALLERFCDRYDLDDLRELVEDGLQERLLRSWRGVLREHIQRQGLDLRKEIEDAVREEIRARVTED